MLLICPPKFSGPFASNPLIPSSSPGSDLIAGAMGMARSRPSMSALRRSGNVSPKMLPIPVSNWLPPFDVANSADSWSKDMPSRMSVLILLQFVSGCSVPSLRLPQDICQLLNIRLFSFCPRQWLCPLHAARLTVFHEVTQSYLALYYSMDSLIDRGRRAYSGMPLLSPISSLKVLGGLGNALLSGTLSSAGALEPPDAE